MRTATLHLTLAFLGDVPLSRIAQLKTLAAQIEFSPFDLRFDFADRWAHNDIVWLGCSAPPHALVELASDLRETLEKAGYTLEKRPFQPHLTLLRKARYAMSRHSIQTPLLQAEAFVLVASRRGADGARYQTLARYPARQRSVRVLE